MTDELLDLAKSYYEVADDLRQQAKQMLATVEDLSKRADALCEEHMRRNPNPTPKPEIQPAVNQPHEGD